jgi:hypothetical protein
MARRTREEMSRRDEMSRLLIGIRGARLQSEAAALAGVTQAKVSRAERGSGPPFSPAEAAAYADALGATPQQRARLVELAEVKTAAHVTTRSVLVRSAAAIQGRIRDLERNSTVLRSWVPDSIPGMLQSRAYTEAMVAAEGVGDPGADWWAARNTRVALLDDPAREWREIISEAALRWVFCTRAAAAAEVEHIIELSHRPNVHVSIVDLATPKPFLTPRGFHLYDVHTAEVATDVGTAFIESPDDIAHFVRLFELLQTHALHGDEARKLLDRLARSLRRQR